MSVVELVVVAVTSSTAELSSLEVWKFGEPVLPAVNELICLLVRTAAERNIGLVELSFFGVEGGAGARGSGWFASCK